LEAIQVPLGRCRSCSRDITTEPLNRQADFNVVGEVTSVTAPSVAVVRSHAEFVVLNLEDDVVPKLLVRLK
jgi:hypothetical protein